MDGKWRPIETAPRDGTDVLLAYRDGTPRLVVAGWWHGRWVQYEYWRTNLPEPFAWQPLPEPPGDE